MFTIASGNVTRNFQLNPVHRSLEVAANLPKPITPAVLPYFTVLRFRVKDVNMDNYMIRPLLVTESQEESSQHAVGSQEVILRFCSLIAERRVCQ